jgi:acetyl-CoA C-acetyltransferase
MLTKAYIPYKGYYSTPFCKWQGQLATINPIILGAETAKRWFNQAGIDPTVVEYLYYGATVAANRMFYAHTWSGAILMDGKKDIPGLYVHQACTTAATCIHLAALNIEASTFDTAFTLMSDRMSNGPHLVWPNPNGPGGEVISENWNMDNINNDPSGGLKMIQTAELVAKEAGITRAECDELTLRRYEQYLDSVADNRAFQKRYMFPVEVALSRKKIILVEEDEGITPTTAEGLAGLKPVEPGGVLTFGTQTHPADGNCGFIVTTREKAKVLSKDPGLEIKIVSYGYARVGKARMAAAPVPAAEKALEQAGLKVGDINVIKTHNPFIVNDLNMAKKMGIDAMSMNNYGSSLIYGHPQAPTTGRLICEMIEELVIKGGGYGLFTGCAAGDTGASLIVKVN